MASLHQLLPDAQDLLSLEPEELAGVLLQALHDEVRREGASRHNLRNFVGESTLREYPSLYRVLPSGLGAVKIENGAMSVVEINAAPFGVLTEPDWDALIK